jgi:hypothetical protein
MARLCLSIHDVEDIEFSNLRKVFSHEHPGQFLCWAVTLTIRQEGETELNMELYADKPEHLWLRQGFTEGGALSGASTHEGDADGVHEARTDG